MLRVLIKLASISSGIGETKMDNYRELQPGDIIHCQGMTCTIKEIAWQDPWKWRESYYLEFTDTNGVYRNWKQQIDGGYAELK